MIGLRREEYASENDELPFVFYTGLERTPYLASKEKNWHDELEIQFCESGSGEVLLNGEKHAFDRSRAIVVNSDVIHYTGTEEKLVYHCLILKNSLFKRAGIEQGSFKFAAVIEEPEFINLLFSLKEIYENDASVCRVAKLYGSVLNIVVKLLENYAQEKQVPEVKNKAFEKVKAAVKWIREHYAENITLQTLANALYTDKYALCRDFKRICGKTVTEYINGYRCQRAADLIASGSTVAEAAYACGFENTSFFSKTFKKYMNVLPSSYKNR